jgi:mono/diheme cytochrome c family protein
MQRSLAASWVGLTASGVLALAGSSACNAFDEAPPGGERTLRTIPVDERAPIESATTPLPISGGTLLSLGARGMAVSDPDRDQISLTGVDANGATTLTTLALSKGAEPGRLAQTSATSFAAVLRGSGEVLNMSLPAEALATQSLTVQWQTKVCEAPRGVDFELSSNQIHVACAEGALVSLDAATGEVVERLDLEPDLRDVVAKDGRLYVSRFRSAEVLFVEQGAIARRVELPTVNVVDHSSGSMRAMQAAVAWRMQNNPSGGVTVVHQRATLDEVPIDAADVADEQSGFGGSSVSPYGGAAGGCGGIVQAAVTQIDADGRRRTTGSLSGVTLPVDLALSPDGLTFAIADAGLEDSEAPRPTVEVLMDGERFNRTFNDFGEHSAVLTFSSAELMDVDLQVTDGDFPSVSCTNGFVNEVLIQTPVAAVAFDGSSLVAQDQRMGSLLSASSDRASGQLEGEPLLDTGHDLFHRNSGGGLACASCHPEGTSDGHVWKFRELGARRTQDLAIPLGKTEPFHWDGELPDLTAIMDEVFVERMGGVFESQERLDVLSNWLVRAPKPVHSTQEFSASAERGKALFDSSETACATCHSGNAFTDNRSYYVGTSLDKAKLQVPSLVGIAARPPFMHDGCAKTLLDRFDPECGGGDAHGVTSQLSTDDLNDLVAYLRTL